MTRYIPSKYDNEDVGFDYGPECECDAPTVEECECAKPKRSECQECGGIPCHCYDDEAGYSSSWKDEREDFHADGFA